MDTEIERFRVNPEVRDRAAQVCAGMGHELYDVLRALLTHIAEDGSIPFPIPTLDRPDEPQRPVAQDERLWTTLKPVVDAEVALALLARFVADCSTQLDEDPPKPNEQQLEKLRADRANAQAVRRTLDVADADAVRQVLLKYGPLVRSHTN